MIEIAYGPAQTGGDISVTSTHTTGRMTARIRITLARRSSDHAYDRCAGPR